MKRRLLVLAHRRELLDQAVSKFQSANDSLTVGIEQAGRTAGSAQVVVASVQTLRGKRLASIDPEDFYLVVVDEAHHAVAPTYRRVFDHLGLMADETSKLLVGFTATPRRGDKRKLGEVFQEIAYSKGIEEMIRDGFLAPISGWRVRSESDLDGVGMRAGDFVESQLARAVDNTPRNALLVRAYRELASGRRCLAFCVNIAHAQNVARAFRAAKLRARAVWGAMPSADRAEALQDLSAGKLDIITNCNVLTEGFDEPTVDCVLMARPTHSLGLYVQMVGRGTRLSPKKKELVVIDIADNSRRHALAGLNTLFDLPEGLDLAGGSVLEMADRVRRLSENQPWVDISRLQSPGDVKLAAERIDFFRLEPPEAIQDVTDLAWLAGPGGGYRLPLARGEAISVVPTLLSDWEIRVHAPNQETRVVGREPELTRAILRSDAFIAQHRRDVMALVSRSAAWRHRAPTERQLALLRSKHIPTPDGLTRGQASWLLSYVLR